MRREGSNILRPTHQITMFGIVSWFVEFRVFLFVQVCVADQVSRYVVPSCCVFAGIVDSIDLIL